LSNGQQCISQAETTLLRALDLENWQAPEPLSYIRNSREAFAAGRLDAEHFQEKYHALYYILTSLPMGYSIIGNLLASLTNGAEIREYRETGTPYLRVGDVKNLTIDKDSVVYVDTLLADKMIEKFRLQTGDVLVSRSGSLAITAVVEQEWANALISSHLIRMRMADNAFDPYYVALFLKSLPGRMQIMQWSNGGVQPEINQPSLERIVIPYIALEIQAEIRQSAMQSHKAKQRAACFLEAAKRAVEIAIEDSETAALDFLRDAEK
jgi:type I restriction enzyme M protein